jgi:hypothetical protein
MKIKGRVYIAGPMRGVKFYNFPAFDAAALEFRRKGWEVVNPAELDRLEHVHEYSDNSGIPFLRQAMKRDLSAICDCTAIALLPGWEKSNGTHVELTLARLLQLEEIICE